VAKVGLIRTLATLKRVCLWNIWTWGVVLSFLALPLLPERGLLAVWQSAFRCRYMARKHKLKLDVHSSIIGPHACTPTH